MGEARAGMSDEAGEFEDLVRDVYANGGRLGEKLGIHFSEISVERLVATMPLSDTEMLQRVRERCEQVEARPAGATKIVEARLEPEA